ASVAPGDSVLVDFAWVGGADVAELRQHAIAAQHEYDANFAPPTATTASLATISADGLGVHVVWSASEPAVSATIERATPGAAWQDVGTARADGNGRIAFDDGEVEPGGRYGYRLRFGSVRAGEAWIDVPSRMEFALLGTSPNPIRHGDWSVSFVVPSAGRVELALFDVAGRCVVRRTYEASSGGTHQVRLGRAEDLRAGLYVLQL